MRSKKLLSLFLVLCMLVPILPAWATDSGTTETASNITWIANHDFDDDADINAWTKGTVSDDTKTVFNLSRTTLEEDEEIVSALEFTATSIPTGNENGTQPTAFLDFEDIEFTSGNKIVIETRFKQVGASAWSYLKFNRPYTVDFTKVSDISDKAEDAQNYWMMLWMRYDGMRHLTVNDYSSSTTFASVDTTSNWTNVQIVIDEGTKTFSIEAKTGDVVNTASGVPFDANTTAKALSGDTAYDSLDNLTLYLRGSAQTLYLDYFRVYEVSPFYSDAMIVGGSTVKYDETAQIKFINVYSDEEKTTSSAVAFIPDDSFVITDKSGNKLETEQSFDSATQIASVKPKDGFVKGESYTITLDEAKLGTIGMNCTGTKSFTVRARDERTNGVAIYDNFANGTDGWEVGASQEGLAATTEAVTADGATDGKALKITFPAKSGSASSSYGTVTKAAGEGIEFKDGKTVTFETRIKKTNIDASYDIRVNRPNTLEQIDYDSSWKHYAIAIHNKGSEAHPTIADTTLYGGVAVANGIGTGFTAAQESLSYISTNLDYNSRLIDFTDKWVTYKITFNPTAGTHTTKVTYTDENNEEQTIANAIRGKMIAPKYAIDREYGEGYFDIDAEQYLDAFERVTFSAWDAGDIYVDYVKVYENVETKAVMSGGRTVEADKGIKLEFVDTGYTKTVVAEDETTTEEFIEGKLDLIPEGSVTVDGVTVAESFDKDTQTLTLTPSEALTVGNTYKVTINTDVLADAGIEYNGTESFDVTARGPRSTGVVVNDSFADASELDNWVIGGASDGYKAVTSIPEDADGAEDGKALLVAMQTNTNAAGGASKIPNVIRNIGNGIEFSADKKIVIKTRMKVNSTQVDSTGTAASTKFHLRMNTIGYENNGAAYDQHATAGWYTYSLFGLGQSVEYPSSAGAANGSSGWFYQKSDITGTASSAILGKWVVYTVILDGINNTTTITAVCDDISLDKTVSGYAGVSPRALVNEYGEGTTKTHFDALDTLSVALFDNANTSSSLLIDYFKVYEQYEAKAVMPEGSSVKYDEAVKLQFVSNNVIASIPAGAVKIDGNNAYQEFDSETNTLSVKLGEDTAFTKGDVYNVTIDKAVLAEEGMVYNGTTEFNVRARDARSTGMVINDNFTTGTEEWEIGATNNATAVVTSVPEATEGATDGKALKITFPAKSNDAYGSVSKLVGDGIEFSDDKTVIVEARVMKTNEASDFHIRVNRPDSATQIANDGPWVNYGIARDWGAQEGIAVFSGIAADIGNTGLYGFPGFTTINSTKVALANKWVTYKFEFKPVNNEYTTTITYTNGTEEVTLGTATGKMHASKTAFDKEYGEGYFNSGDMKYYNALDRLTFTSWTEGDIYIDYVKAYEVYEAFATIPEGSSVKSDEPIKLVFTSNEDIKSIPAGAVKINGNNAYQEYDAETKTLSVKPAENTAFTEGDIYSVTIDKTVLATEGITYTGTENFEVRARAERSSGEVINDTFDGTYADDAASFDGWSAGAANEGYAADIDVVTSADDENAIGANGGALKISMKAPLSGDGNQSSVTRLIGDGIEFKDNTHITVKTRIKRTSSDTNYYIKMNRPDTIKQTENEFEWKTYGIVAAFAGTEGIGTATYFGELGGKFTTLPAGPDSKGIDYGSQWVEYTIVFKPETKCYYVTAIAEDGTIILNERVGANGMTVPAAEREYGVGTEKDRFNALERLTFYGQTAGDIYVDYVQVYSGTSVEEKISAKLVTGDAEADVLTEGQTIVPSFELQPKDAAETTYYTISAMYVDGKLDKFVVTPVTTTGTTTSHTAYTVPETTGRVEIKAFVWDDKFVPLCNAAAAVKEAVNTFSVYVRTNGDDNATEADAPVATLGEALNRVYAATESGEAEAAVIYVGEGNYKVEDTISIPSTAKIPENGLIIKNETSNKPVFVGGNTYTGTDMIKVTAENDTYEVLDLVPEDTKDKLYMIKLAGVDIPAVSYPGPEAYRVDKIVKGLELETDETLTDVSVDAAFDGELMTIARWPNVNDDGSNNYAVATSVSGATEVESYHTILSKYADESAVSALDADTKATLTTDIQNGITVGVPSDKDISGWNTKGALMFGYWGRDWATQTMPVGVVDNSAKTITSKYASSFGAKADARFYVYNLLCELDTDGEYYIDRTNNVMYFRKDTAPAAENKVTISLLDNTKSMLRIASDSKVTVDGLIFENSRGEGIYLEGSTGTVVKNCEIRNLGSRGICVSGRGAVIENNFIHDTNGGIIIYAQDSENDVKYLTQSDNIIHNNEIKNYGRLDRTYVDGIFLGGTGNTVSNNKIHDAEHLAVRISGYNNTFKNNEITNVLNQVDDAGAIYVGRTWASRGNKIVSNYIHDIKTTIDSANPIAGIFMDDHYASITIEGNVFKNITNGHGVRGNRGRENTITNNLFINCTEGGVRISGPNYDDNKADSDYSTHITSLENIRVYAALDNWKTAFPTLCAIMGTADSNGDVYAKWADPAAMMVTKNLAIGCGTEGVSVAAFAATYEDTFNGYSLNSDVSNNGGSVTPAVCGTDAETGNSYVSESVSADTFSDIVANPGAATAERASDAGITGFTAIDWASMRK